MATRERDRDRELLLLLPIGGDPLDRRDDPPAIAAPSTPSTPSTPPSSHRLRHLPAAGKEAFSKAIRSWASNKFITGFAILFPITITFYTTWFLIHFADGFFSPVYDQLGINTFGLGFITSIMFIFLVGVFMSSWLGASVLGLGEWIIKKMPLISLIYSALKQISAAISPDQNSRAFKEVVILSHPRVGEYAIGFITSTVILRRRAGDEELYSVYIPTNNLYIGDIVLINTKDAIKPKLSVIEATEIIISGGLTVPQVLSVMDTKATI